MSLLLSALTTRMRLLKRFKYGKHIVNRVEKLRVQRESLGEAGMDDAAKISSY